MTAATTWTARLPRRRDVLLAAIFAVATVAAAALYARVNTGNRALDLAGVLLIAAITGPIALRRWPLVALAVGLVPLVPYHLLRYPPEVILPAVMVLLYTVAVAGSRLRAAAAGAVTLIAVLVPMRLSGGGWPGDDAVDTAGWLVAAVAFGLAIGSQRAYAQALAERARRAEHARDQEARQRVAEERLRIARDLHDVIAHHISVISMQSSVAAYLIDRGERDPRLADLSRSLRHIAGAGGAAMSELRAILDVLRSEGPGEGSRDALPSLDRLPELIESMREAGMEVTFTRLGDPHDLSAAVDVAAYRIIQEALTNAGRHAGGAPVAVSVDYRPSALYLAVADRGTAQPGQPVSYGHGLTGMTERAHAAGGSLQARPRPGGGFLVEAVLPTARSADRSGVAGGAAR